METCLLSLESGVESNKAAYLLQTSLASSCLTLKTCLQVINRWCIPPLHIWRPPLQHLTGARCRGHHQLCLKDACEDDMKACNIKTKSWEATANNRTLWKQQVKQGLKRREAAIWGKNYERWVRITITASQQQDHADPHQASVFTCQGCSRDCKSRIGLYSDTQWYSPMTSHSTTP